MNRQPIRTLRREALAGVAAVVLLLGLAGCLARHHSQIGASLLDDKVTTDRVEAALKANAGPEFQHVQVNTTNGVVTLSGSVKDEAARQRAAQAAQSVHRVKQLDNQLKLER